VLSNILHGRNGYIVIDINSFCIVGGFHIPPRVVEGVDRLPVCVGDQVSVRVHGDLDGVVPELLLDVDRGFSVRDEQGGEGVSRQRLTPPGPIIGLSRSAELFASA
jgi:hypothetical protein